MKFKLRYDASFGGVFYKGRVWHDGSPELAKDALFARMVRRGHVTLDDDKAAAPEAATLDAAPETATTAKPIKRKRTTKKDS